MDPLAVVGVMILCITLSNLRIGTGQSAFNVISYGAKGDGIADDTQAFLNAWKAACGATGSTPTLQIPSSTFLLKILKFEGPCKSSSVRIQNSGKIVAPSSVSAWGTCSADSWLSFVGIEGLILDGSGSIDGRGSAWWYQTACERPRALHFDNCNGLQISGLSFINSPRAHIVVDDSSGVTITNIKITAPQESPNTDGIDIARSTQVNIFDSFIGTGDDCIAINDGCSYINITNIACGPGHGISIGSLGDRGTEETVEEVHVSYCNFTSTTNGARIKTQPGGKGYARKIAYDQIRFIGAGNPIIIDQHYCNGQRCAEKSTAVVVSDITFSNMYGTSKDGDVITLDCDSIGCDNIRMEEINIRSLNPGENGSVVCSNAKGEATSVTPPVPCLSG